MCVLVFVVISKGNKKKKKQTTPEPLQTNYVIEFVFLSDIFFLTFEKREIHMGAKVRENLILVSMRSRILGKIGGLWPGITCALKSMYIGEEKN